MGDSGQKLIETYMKMNDLVLNGTTITLELPNESSKKDFETQKHNLLNYLRGKLHNHDVSIQVIVNEEVEKRFAFTDQEKFDYLYGINPALELLKKTFDLQF